MLRQDLTLTVEESSDAAVRLRLEGSALLARGGDVKSFQGFDVRLLGSITYDRTRKAFERFDVVALGDSWGTTDWSQKGGRYPVGLAFELAGGRSPCDRMIPLHLPENPDYFASR